MRGARKKHWPALRFHAVEGLPLVNHFLERLRLRRFLGAYLPDTDRRRRLPPADAMAILVRNLLLCREPLYGVGDWARRFAPALLELSPDRMDALNDDSLGRALDDLFEADRRSLVLAVVTHAVREFGVQLRRFHNDSTSISFEGEYRQADGRPHRGKPTLRITYGHSKDKRPDLKQLLWSLTVSDDGAVPADYQVLDGNIVDDHMHPATWDVLVTICGDANFLYVADSKLCTRPNMLHISGRGGRFLTVLPATRKEDKRFKDFLQSHEVPWQEIFRRPNPARKKALPDIFRAYEDPAGTSEGYRLVWYHSTEKEKRDRQERDDRIDRAIRELQDLKDRLASPRTRLRKRNKVDEQIQAILESSGAARWIEVEVDKKEDAQFRQARPGRPGPDTPYRKKSRVRFDITWASRPDTLAYDLKTDGIFPLVTCDRKLTPLRMLKAYKLGQPRVEVRHHNLKGTHEVAPQYLKRVWRIEAFLCLYFFALLVNSLIERELRAGMRRAGAKALALYHEGRPCKRPTTDQILRVFEGLMVHELRGPGRTRKVYSPELNRLQKRLLRLLRISAQRYRFA